MSDTVRATVPVGVVVRIVEYTNFCDQTGVAGEVVFHGTTVFRTHLPNCSWKLDGGRIEELVDETLHQFAEAVQPS